MSWTMCCSWTGGYLFKETVGGLKMIENYCVLYKFEITALLSGGFSKDSKIMGDWNCGCGKVTFGGKAKQRMHWHLLAL